MYKKLCIYRYILMKYSPEENDLCPQGASSQNVHVLLKKAEEKQPAMLCKYGPV